MDIWAVGCILGEMLIGKPIFPGISNKDQFKKMVEVIGKPSQEDLEELR